MSERSSIGYVMAGPRAGHPGSPPERVALGGRVKPGHDGDFCAS